jgi:general secretion pathway protein C
MSTFILWALALFCAAYWLLRVMATPSGAPTAPPVVRTPAPANPAALAALLGSRGQVETGNAAPQASLASRFVLTGVVAGRSGEGAALIAVDGRSPRPFRVGARVEEGLILQAVDGRRVMLGAERGGPHAVVLELPPLQK